MAMACLARECDVVWVWTVTLALLMSIAVSVCCVLVINKVKYSRLWFEEDVPLQLPMDHGFLGHSPCLGG